MVIAIEQKGKKGIIIFDRDENNKRIVKEITDFIPYFYADDPNGKFKSIFNEPLKKIVVESSGDVPREREKYKKTYESNIKFTQRYLIDCIKVPIKKTKLRLCFMDIETDDSLNVGLAEKPITTVGFYDSYINKYYDFAWRKDLKKESIKKENIEIYKFNNEKSVIFACIKLISHFDPDLIIGFNIDFDLGYFINRAKLLGIQPNTISPLNYTKIDKWGVKVYGRVVFDMRRGYKSSFDEKNLGIYNLDNVAIHVLGKGKKEINMMPGELWRKDIDKLIEYNIEDVKLLVEIDEKLHMIDYFDQRRRDNGCLWSNVFAFSAVNSVAFLREAKNRDQAVPTIFEKFDFGNAKGADVGIPIPNLYSYIIFLDIKGEYPSFMRASNISPETISEDGDIKLGNGLCFKSEPKGIVPAIIEGQMERRDESKKLMRQYEFGSREYITNYIIQDSNKKLSNSWYGLFNSKYFLMQNKDLTEATTWGGRELKGWSIKIVEKNGYKTIYSDTDGLFVDSKAANLDEAKKIGKMLENKINETYDGFCKVYSIKENIFKIEFERIYKKFFIKVKKRYVGLLCWENGQEIDDKMIVKGYEIIRIDTAKICADVQEKIFRMVVEGKKKTDIEDYINKIKDDLKNNKYSLFDIGFPKPWKEREYTGKTVFHIAAAKYSNKYLGTNFGPNSRFLVVYIKSIANLPEAPAIAFDKKTKLPKNLKIDWDKQIPVLIDNKIERIYEALGWDKEEKSKSLFEKW